MLYLDHAATTPMRPEARDAMLPYFDDRFGNPSGIHGAARRAKDAIEASRERAAELIGAAHPLEIVFVGGGTEAEDKEPGTCIFTGKPSKGRAVFAKAY